MPFGTDSNCLAWCIKEIRLLISDFLYYDEDDDGGDQNGILVWILDVCCFNTKCIVIILYKVVLGLSCRGISSRAAVCTSLL